MSLRFALALTLLCALCMPLSAQTAVSTQTPDSFEAAVRGQGTPDIPGLNMVWLTPWGRLALARDWRNIVVHQSEGAPGSAWRSAVAQMERPDRRGVTIWVETDGTVYWAVAEFAVPHHINGNRTDNKFIDNTATFQQVDNDNSIGIEFVGNYPNVRRPVTDAQVAAWKMLLKVLQTRYNITSDHVYAHNWIDYKDSRYCEGCELARLAQPPNIESAGHLEAAHIEKAP
jgi:hypothetical protein